MKKLKKTLAILLTCTLLMGLAGCSSGKSEGSKSNENASTDSHYPVTITTYNYEKQPVELTFDKAPEKVFAVYQNSIETLLALGLEDKIVAAAGLDHDVKDEYKEAFSKVKYMEEFTPSKEAVIMEKPDFILGWYSLFNEKRLGDIKYWNDNNINTYISLNSGVVQDKTIQNEVTDILNLGKIFNVEDKAQKLVDEINNKVKEVSEAAGSKEKQNTLVIEFAKDDITVYGKNTLAGDMVDKLGAELADQSGNKIGKEDIIKANPDSIFVVYMDREGEDVPTQEVNRILENPEFASLDAVKNKRVYAIPLGEMYCSGVRTIDGLNAFAKGLFPEMNK